MIKCENSYIFLKKIQGDQQFKEHCWGKMDGCKGFQLSKTPENEPPNQNQNT